MKRALIVLFLFVAVGEGIGAPYEVGLSGYTKRLWDSQDGLSDQTIQDFAQAADGSLWIATKIGLLRFDGVRFSMFDRGPAAAALERGVNCLLVSRDGNLWIGTEGGGLVRFRNGAFQRYSTAGGVANEFVRAIYEDRNGEIWVGADQGLFRVAGASIAKIDGIAGTPPMFVRAFAEDQRGHLWVGGTTILEFKGTAFVRQYPLSGGPSANLITSMFSARNGTLWVGTLSGLHWLLPSGALDRVAGISAQVDAIHETSDGTIWIGTVGQGLFNYRHSQLFRIGPGNLPSKTVKALLEDREGNIWIGTQSGIMRLSSTPLGIVPFPAGADSEFETLSYDSDGSIWVGASEHLFHIQDGVAEPAEFPGLPHLRARVLLRDREGRLWIGSNGAGLYLESGSKISRFTTGHGLINDFVRAILESRDGSVWVGTDGGLTHLGPKGSENLGTPQGLAYFSVTALFEDRSGDVWVGTSRGLTHISHGQIVHDAVTAALAQEQFWCINQDASGELWFGASSGLYGLKDGKMIHLTIAQGLASNTIYEILNDAKGNIWLGSPNAISRLRRSDLDTFKEGSAVSLSFYEDSSDMDSATLYGGMQPEGAIAPNGDVWFPSNRGAIHIAASKIVPATSSSVTIDGIVAEGQPVPLKQKIDLEPGNAQLEISYAVIRLGSQEGIRYRYTMEGLESWHEVFTRRTAYYTHLPPGKYRFRVQAYEVGNPGAVSEASILIVQRPHVYATPWFLVCCAASLVCVAFLVYRLRFRQMKIRFQAVNEERARLAREMHDTVIQGCVGVSTLLEAALGVETPDEPLRDQLLNYATDQVRTTIESARDAVWSLRNASASTSDVGFLCEKLAHQFQSESGIPIECRITGSPVKLGEQATHEIVMAVKEAIANAITHADPSTIQIDVRFSGQEVAIEIRDDGCGFEPGSTQSNVGHYGILGMQERIHLLRGTLKIESDQTHGTMVRIVVPRRQRTMERNAIGNANGKVFKN
jgi:ligand-binding sensor domain-containing protein/signal transduction histidine kinase